MVFIVLLANGKHSAIIMHIHFAKKMQRFCQTELYFAARLLDNLTLSTKAENFESHLHNFNAVNGQASDNSNKWYTFGS